MIFKLLPLALLVLVNSVNGQGYVGAVLEYAPRSGDSGVPNEQSLLLNTQLYVSLIQQARSQLANIVVFPEYGLTTTFLPPDLTSISTTVPHPSLAQSPCNDSTTTAAKFLIDLSCAARTHGIYTVVNVLEQERQDETNVTIFYNTNVAFDTNGTVIARYRKINLFNEPQLTPGNEVVTFRVLDVTFGLFTGFDILFRRPAQEVLEQGATDIIYTSAWTSETPFHQGLSVQDGYAKAAGVNFLSAGYSNVTGGVAGAAIFSANGSILAASLTPAAIQNIIYATIPRVINRTPQSICNGNVGTVDARIGWLPELSSVFQVMHENLEHYTFQDLELGVNQTTGTICSEGSSFCCDYNITFNEPLTENNTIYRMVAFHGRRGFPGTNVTTAGLRTCALLHCSSSDNLSCGLFNTTTNVNFLHILITAQVPNNTDTFYQPTTLDTSHRTLERYSYCTNAESDAETIRVTMSVDRPHNVFSFGIFGRDQSEDGREAGRGSATSIQLTFLTLLTACICAMLRH